MKHLVTTPGILDRLIDSMWPPAMRMREAIERYDDELTAMGREPGVPSPRPSFGRRPPVHP